MFISNRDANKINGLPIDKPTSNDDGKVVYYSNENNKYSLGSTESLLPPVIGAHVKIAANIESEVDTDFINALQDRELAAIADNNRVEIYFKNGSNFQRAAIPATTPNTIVVSPKSTAAASGQALYDAILTANALNPWGAVKSSTNKITVAIMPGFYDVPNMLSPASYVNLVGVTGNPDDVWISRSIASGWGTSSVTGTLQQGDTQQTLSGFTVQLTGTTTGSSTDTTYAFVPTTSEAANTLSLTVSNVRIYQDAGSGGKFHAMGYVYGFQGDSKGSGVWTNVDCDGYGWRSVTGKTLTGHYTHCNIARRATTLTVGGWTGDTLNVRCIDCIIYSGGGFGNTTAVTSNSSFLNCHLLAGGSYAFGLPGSRSTKIVSCSINGQAYMSQLAVIDPTADLSTASGYASLEMLGTAKLSKLQRLTTAQADAIYAKEAGMFVYDTTLNKFKIYDGSAWQTITSV